jgi:hypothetical protein
MGSWWWFWLVFMFLFLLPPIGYGWGYRGWGPPLPSYVQRRRGPQTGRAADFNAQSWGWGGDFVWIIAFIGGMWALSALLWGWGRW